LADVAGGRAADDPARRQGESTMSNGRLSKIATTIGDVQGTLRLIAAERNGTLAAVLIRAARRLADAEGDLEDIAATGPTGTRRTTAERRAALLAALAECGSVTEAARRAGVSVTVHYHAMAHCPDYRAAVDRLKTGQPRPWLAAHAATRANGAERRRQYLEALARHGIAYRAAVAAKVDPRTVNTWRRRYPEFAAAVAVEAGKAKR
jgi:hypothetical protein